MKAFVSDIIPKIQRFSEKLDNLTLLTNQHWVVLNEIEKSKIVYIFRSSNQLLIAQNGKVEKAKWEYLGSNSLLIDRKDESYIYRHGFFDENILALKIDGLDEYNVLVNENRFDGDINSIEKAIDFLNSKYIELSSVGLPTKSDMVKLQKLVSYETDKGLIEIPPCISFKDQPVYLKGEPAPNGKYKIGYFSYIHVLDGFINKHTNL